MANETIGIKLADGTFYPILTEGVPAKKYLDLTTASDNQTTIQVNLYRSKTASMDDAVYVDTLVIDNLVPHGKNEPDITLSLGLDENNQLTAEVKDPESGAHIEKSAVLQTLGNDVTGPTDSDFTISEAEPFQTQNQETVPETIIEEPVEEEQALSDEPNFDDIKFDDDLIDEHAAASVIPLSSENSGIISDANTFTIPEEPQEDLVTDENFFSDINFDDEKTDVQENTADENIISEEPVLTENSENVIEGDTTEALTEELTEYKEENTTDSSAAEDFTFDDTLKAVEPENNGSSLSEEEFPDFDDIEISEDSKIVSDTNNEEKVESLFDFDDNFDDTIPTPSISFNDLYDQESIEGVTEEEEEEAVRKTTVPVTICVICAIICIAVLCLLLFFKPVKVFLTGKNEKVSDDTVLKVADTENKSLENYVQETKEEIVETVEEIAEEAKPEEIVIVETPVVAPVAPAPAAPEVKTVKHHIRWGDTLWDIAGTYYKNPWLYKKIARANGIKNPDLIISGNDIIIPEK